MKEILEATLSEGQGDQYFVNEAVANLEIKTSTLPLKSPWGSHSIQIYTTNTGLSIGPIKYHLLISV